MYKNKKYIKNFLLGCALVIILLVAINYQFSNNPCKGKKLIASQDSFEIPHSQDIGKGILLKVERWGAFSYGYANVGKSTYKDVCQATSYEKPDDPTSGVVVSIGNNLNVGYTPFATFTLDLTVDSDSKSTGPYDAEYVMQKLADSFIVEHQGTTVILKMKKVNPGDDLSIYKGSWVFQKINDIPYYSIYAFQLVSTDQGRTWDLQTL